MHVLSANMAEQVFGQFVVKKKNTKSSVWQLFSLLATENGKVVEKEQDRPICRTCGKRVQAKASNTTNLFQHLREHHPMIYAEVAPKKLPKRGESSQTSTSNTTQVTLGGLVAKSAMYSPSSPQANELNRAVAYHVAKDAEPPLSTSQGFSTWFLS